MIKQNAAQHHRSRRSDVTCQQVTSLILNYVRGELHPGTALALKAHLRECPDCVAFLATYKKTIQATNSLRYETIPPTMRKRVRQFFQKSIKSAFRTAIDLT